MDQSIHECPCAVHACILESNSNTRSVYINNMSLGVIFADESVVHVFGPTSFISRTAECGAKRGKTLGNKSR